MIISRTPLRMSFVGGGSDMPQFYREYGGAVLSSAIDKYIYITANKKFDCGIRISYSVTEDVQSASEVMHPLARHALEFIGISGGVEITSVADIPSKGTGLGSSSSFCVGILNVLNAFKGKFSSAAELAEGACHIEIDLMGEPIGRQDQYAAAYGDLQFYEFRSDDRVVVSPVIMSQEARSLLQRRLLMFYTGITRSASAILSDQAKNVTVNSTKVRSMQRMVELAYNLRSELQSSCLESFGDILHENWVLKQSMADGISNSMIDTAYDAARAAGAKGGKILGAGAGGFLLLYADEEAHNAIERALLPMRRIPFLFEKAGSRIIFAG
ncbi:GHMP family kinase ATP-binding protein [Brucella sp. 2716]|uniref:GHMP family kinase ATP-binding protein n=1 Tax=Brucella sp. 2716 TaxID=2975052 RepID=UPI00217E0DE4|nr:GHMP kinase [Brucella sp. 2716]UWF59413.1 GHMP kinase [Brucella sp. 2716]